MLRYSDVEEIQGRVKIRETHAMPYRSFLFCELKCRFGLGLDIEIEQDFFKKLFESTRNELNESQKYHTEKKGGTMPSDDVPEFF